MAGLRQLLCEPRIDMGKVRTYLDKLSETELLSEIHSLRRQDQSRLFDAAENWDTMTVEDLVPEISPEGNEVVHRGRNTLPFFQRFAKAFIRQKGEIWGYNRTSTFIETVVGPGYFLVEKGVQGELLINYAHVPKERPAHWPPILPNSKRFSRFVYHQTQDRLRKVSTRICIGRAQKKGRALPAWFVLVREESHKNSRF